MRTLILGQRVELIALVTRSMGNTYEVTDGLLVYRITIKEAIAVGEVISIHGIVEELSDLRIKCEKIDHLLDEEKQKKGYEIKEKMRAEIKITERELMVQDSLMQEIKPQLIELTKHLLLAKKLNRFILLRYHGDADGISGACAITSFLRAKAEQQNAAVYSTREAIKDLNFLANEYQPLALFIDFGAGKESIEAFKLLKGAGVEIIVIDHHPPAEEIEETVDFFLSPWQIESEEIVSQYTAGYLACEVAGFAGIEKLEEYARMSCAGDKSTILPITEDDKDRALVIDFIAMYSGFGNNLEFYKNTLKNQDLFHSILQQAKEKIHQVREAAVKIMQKQQCGEIAIYSIELDELIKEHEFPSRGKVATMIFEHIGNERPSLVIGYGKKSVILRANQLAVEEGFAVDRLISEIKSSMKNFIESGGGHARAAAIRTREGFSKTVAEGLIALIRQKIETENEDRQEEVYGVPQNSVSKRKRN